MARQPRRQVPSRFTPAHEGQAAADRAHLHRVSDEKTAAGQRPDLPLARDIPTRIGTSALVAAFAAGAAYLAVRIFRFVGWLVPDTPGASVAIRIGVPAAVFLITFVFIYWRTGRDRGPAKITAGMSDEEIARALKGR